MKPLTTSNQDKYSVQLRRHDWMWRKTKAVTPGHFSEAAHTTHHRVLIATHRPEAENRRHSNELRIVPAHRAMKCITANFIVFIVYEKASEICY